MVAICGVLNVSALCVYYKMSRGLTDKEITNIFEDDIPSGDESIVSDEELCSDEIDLIESDESDAVCDSVPPVVDETLKLMTEKTMRQQAHADEGTVSWSKRNASSTIPPFTGQSGVTDYVKNISCPTPYKLFSLFFSDELVDMIVFQTNLYSTQMGKPFIRTNAEEIKSIFGNTSLYGNNKET